MSTTKPQILLFPTELQVQILSYLDFIDRLSASLACTQWQDILLSTTSFRQDRYPPSMHDDLPCIHKIIGGPLDQEEESVGHEIFCTVQAGSVLKYEIQDHYVDFERVFDISPSPMLDEPILSPFTDRKFSPRMEHVPLMDPIKGKVNPKYKEKEPSGVYENDDDVFLPYIDSSDDPDPVNKEAYRDHRCPIVFIMAGVHNTDISTGFWAKRFNLTQDLTVRRAIEKLVRSLNIRYQNQGMDMERSRLIRLMMSKVDNPYQRHEYDWMFLIHAYIYDGELGWKSGRSFI